MAADLAPGFLVASPSLRDPNFRQTVVLLIEHRSQGSLGFVINRSADVSFESVVEDLNLVDEAKPPPKVPVLVGGPVQRNTGWIVFDPHHSDIPLDSTVISVAPRVRVSASKDILRKLAQTPNATRHLLVLGYAGWGAGQLDTEIRQGAWIPVDLDDQVVFETPYEERWEQALVSAGINPMLLVGSVRLDA